MNILWFHGVVINEVSLYTFSSISPAMFGEFPSVQNDVTPANANGQAATTSPFSSSTPLTLWALGRVALVKIEHLSRQICLIYETEILGRTNAVCCVCFFVRSKIYYYKFFCE